jgi:hypothetical protein
VASRAVATRDGRLRLWIRDRSAAPVLYADATQRKVLVGAAESVDWTRRMKGKGILAAKLQIDWPELMRFKRSFTEPVPKPATSVGARLNSGHKSPPLQGRSIKVARKTKERLRTCVDA